MQDDKVNLFLLAVLLAEHLDSRAVDALEQHEYDEYTKKSDNLRNIAERLLNDKV